MSVKFEELEHNLVSLEVVIPAEEIAKAEDEVYKKMKGRITVPGFRKGKAPRSVIENAYGKGVFLEDAINDILPNKYEEAVKEAEKEHDFKAASLPEIDYSQAEPGKDYTFTAKLAKRPSVELGEYKGIKVESESIEVTEDDIKAELEKEQNKNASVVPVEDRPVADGDIVTLDFLGKVDGVAFEGGEGHDYPLTIGSGSFIPGFEEQMIGMKLDETRDLDVTFPEEYHEKNLAGKPAVFTVTVKAIKTRELPTLDDEFASMYTDFETLEEYKEDIKKKLSEQKEKQAKTNKENAILEKIVEGSKMDVPELMIKSEAKSAVERFARQMQAQGLTIEQYMQYTGQSEQDLIDSQMEPQKKAIMSRLVLEAIVKAEGIEATEDDVAEEIKKMAEQYQMEADKVRELLGEEQINIMKEDLAVNKAVDFIYNAAK